MSVSPRPLDDRDLERLTRLGPPFLHLVEGSVDDLYTLHWHLMKAGMSVRELRGDRIATDEDMFDELAVAWQFPSYFGYNWNAVEDCLYYLELTPTALGYATLVRNAGSVFGSNRTAYPLFLRVMIRSGRWWAAPHDEPNEHPATPFHLVIQGDDAELSQIEAASASDSDLAGTFDRFSILGLGGRPQGPL